MSERTATVILAGGPVDGHVHHDVPVDAAGVPVERIVLPAQRAPGDPGHTYVREGGPDPLGLWTYRHAPA